MTYTIWCHLGHLHRQCFDAHFPSWWTIFISGVLGWHVNICRQRLPLLDEHWPRKQGGADAVKLFAGSEQFVSLYNTSKRDNMRADMIIFHSVQTIMKHMFVSAGHPLCRMKYIIHSHKYMKHTNCVLPAKERWNTQPCVYDPHQSVFHVARITICKPRLCSITGGACGSKIC